MQPATVVVDDLVAQTELANDLALGEGLAPVLLAVGALLIVFSMAVFGFLTVGAVVDFVVPE